MKFVNNIKDKYSARVNIAGGKGANLNFLIRANFNVPDGIILNTKAFSKIIHHEDIAGEIKRQLAQVRVADSNSITTASKNIRAIILKVTFPNEVENQISIGLDSLKTSKVAVRSSGVVEDNPEDSWAGQFDTFLNVEKSEVILAIKKCWASFFSSRAISYNIRAYKNFKKLKFAVVIQEMVNSEKSGVAFSVEPTTFDRSKILIEATKGLGENLVSGKSLDFTATVEKRTGFVVKAVNSIRDSHLLEMQEVSSLASSVTRIEKLYRQPVDIEWAICQGRFYFLQVRPITSLRSNKESKQVAQFPNIDNYELTFKVAGLSFLFTDILAHGFKYLDPLFTSDERGEFLQYFTNEKMEYAARLGMAMFSRKNGFEEYQKRFTSFYEKHLKLLDEILNKPSLTKSSSYSFFKILSRLLAYYSRMDNQFTNLAYLYLDENETVKHNLQLLSKFKDYARVWINSTLLEDASHLSRFLNRLCTEFEMSRAELECYKVNELLQLFYGNYLPIKTIEKRKLSYVIYHKNGLNYVTGERALGMIKKFAFRNDSISSAEIRGKVANKVQKKISGQVHVINVDYGNMDQMNIEIQKMHKGEILVAEFTAPELLEACRKAKAIITDVGGLLSHAAIVSRELNIPCLVGTGNATKKLKTGDFVSIDFEMGVVNQERAGLE